MYQALYRKYRPKTFDDVVGQEHITETLKKQVETGRLSHAYLFIGTRGTGKTTCAKILAKAVNCEHPVNGNPCNQCAACRGIDDGSILDVVELDAASNNGVDNVRALRDEAVFSPANVRKRVYIIDEVHMLSTSAFNALLKILEEPPAHLMFILATTELHKVPATILSRCQRHSFKRIPVDTIAARLNYVAQQEHLNLQPDAAALLARMADGGMRDALTLLDQCSGSDVITTETVISAMGLAGNLRTAQLLQSIADGDTAKTLEQFRSLWQDGKDPAALLDELSMLQRDLLMQAVAPRGGRELLSGGYDSETLQTLSGAFTPAQLLANLQSIQDALTAMAAQPNPRIAAELCLIRLCRPELCDDVPTLCARVDKLEQAVRSGKALYAGLSNYDGPTLEKAAAILDELHVPFVINQNRYSIFDRTIEHNGLKDTAAKLHKGIITFSPLAQGLLTDRYLHGIPADSRVHTDGRFLKEKDITPERLAQISALNDLARQRGQTLAEMALAWLLHHDEVTTVLIGASKTQQILDNIKAVEHTTFTPDELAVIDRISK